jgi:hypothetical protein
MCFSASRQMCDIVSVAYQKNGPIAVSGDKIKESIPS